MATLDEDGDVPGDAADVGAVPLGPVARLGPPGDMPPGLLAPGAAPGQPVAVDGAVGSSPRQPQVVRPHYEPQEPERNTVLRGEPPAPSTKSPMTDMQRRIADAHLADPSATQKELAQSIGASPQAVSAALNKPIVRMYLSQHLDAAGASIQRAAQVVAAGLDAKLPQKDPETGEVSESGAPDYSERRQSARLALEGHGALEEVGTQVNIYQHLTDEQLAAVACGQAKMSDFVDMRPQA